MSSHREAPESSKDPTADSTDVYAFVSPDAPTTVTLIANYIPFESPDGGPNFYEFGADVLYAINIDNDGDGLPNISYQFKFTTTDTPAADLYFLYNTAPITAPTGAETGYQNWSRPQTYTLTRVDYVKGKAPKSTTLGTDLLVPPCNIGPASTANYAADLVPPAIHQNLSAGGHTVTQAFAGQRAEGFYVDLGAVFDLGTLRGFEEANAHSPFKSAAMGVNSTDRVNVHSLALQIPITELTASGMVPASSTSPGAVIGVWTTASRQKVRVYGGHKGETVSTGPYVQVSRLGNPLVNELLIPLAQKDLFNSSAPVDDKQFVTSFSNPGLAQLLPALYPGAFPNLKMYNAGSPDRMDIVAILLTGIPAGVVAPSYTTNTGTVQADMLRLNVAIPPADTPNNVGVLGGDVAGFPNGRRVFDDVATIELRAVAGATLVLTDPGYTPDGLAGAPGAAFGTAPGNYVNFGLTSSQTDLQASGQAATAAKTEYYLESFPYLATPHNGFDASTPAAAAAGGVEGGPLAASGA
jgi:hypothetical protein